MEKQFFKWNSLDHVGDLEIMFYECTLVNNVGRRRAGESYQHIIMNFETGTMTFPDGDVYILNFKIMGKFNE